MSDRPGIAKMRAETPEGLCPFCLDPLGVGGRNQAMAHCGDPVCKVAYNRCYQRDRRAMQRTGQWAPSWKHVRKPKGRDPGRHRVYYQKNREAILARLKARRLVKQSEKEIESPNAK